MGEKQVKEYFIERATATNSRNRYDTKDDDWEGIVSGASHQEVLGELLTLANDEYLDIDNTWLRLKTIYQDGTTEVETF